MTNWLWLIVPACICLVLVIPFLLTDIKESKQDSLRTKIHYKIHTVYQATNDEESELEWLERMSTAQWLASYLKKKYNKHFGS